MIPGVFVREMRIDERNMVLAGWKASLAETEQSTGRLSRREFYALANHVIDDVVLPSCAVLVAASAGDDGVEIAHGWVAIDGDRIVYGYVKPKYRRMGLFRLLREASRCAWSGFDLILELERHGKEDRQGHHEATPQVRDGAAP